MVRSFHYAAMWFGYTTDPTSVWRFSSHDRTGMWAKSSYKSKSDDVNPEVPSSLRSVTNQVYRAACVCRRCRYPTQPTHPHCVATPHPIGHPYTKRLYLILHAIGMSGNQFKNAGVAGRLMKEIIETTENGDADLDHSQFKPQPYSWRWYCATLLLLKTTTFLTPKSVLGWWRISVHAKWNYYYMRKFK